jgi:hypothetical protein
MTHSSIIKHQRPTVGVSCVARKGKGRENRAKMAPGNKFVLISMVLFVWYEKKKLNWVMKLATDDKINHVIL